MVLRARWEDIHQKVDIAGQVEIVVADCCHGGRGRDTAGPDFREPSVPEARFPRSPLLGIWVNRSNGAAPSSMRKLCKKD